MRFTGKTMFAEFTKGAIPPLWMWLRFFAFGGLAILLQNIGYERIGHTVLIITCVQIIGHIAAAGFKSVANGINRIVADIRGEPVPGSPEAKKLERQKRKAKEAAIQQAEADRRAKRKAATAAKVKTNEKISSEQKADSNPALVEKKPRQVPEPASK